MPNHHEKDLTAVLTKNARHARKPLPSVTLAEGFKAVKQSAYSLGRSFASP